MEGLTIILSKFQAYLGAFNFGQADVTLSIREITAMENKKLDGATVVISSSNAVQYSPRQKVDLSSGTVTLPPEQGVVFKVTSWWLLFKYNFCCLFYTKNMILNFYFEEIWQFVHEIVRKKEELLLIVLSFVFFLLGECNRN